MAQRQGAPQVFTDKAIENYHKQFLKNPDEIFIGWPFIRCMQFVAKREEKKLEEEIKALERGEAERVYNGFDEQPEETMKHNKKLLEFLSCGVMGAGTGDPPEEVRQRLAALAFMDGSKTDFKKLTKRLNEVLGNTEKRQLFAVKYLGCLMGQYPIILKSPRRLANERPSVREYCKLMRKYLMMSCKEREVAVPELTEEEVEMMKNRIFQPPRFRESARFRRREQRQDANPAHYTDEDLHAYFKKFLANPSSTLIDEDPEFRRRILFVIEREGEKLKKEFKDLKKGDEKVGNLRNLEFQQDVLLEFLKNNCEFNDVVIQRLASFAYMDGSLIYYDELARCIDEVLITKARKRKFAEIYLGWSLEQFEKLLAEPEEHVGDFENDKCFAWIIEYLQSKSEDRVKLVVLPDVSEDDTDQAHGAPAAPASPAPADHAPVGSAPVNPAPVDNAPVSSAPANPAPVNPAPAEHAPADHAPADHAPVDPAPANPAPVNPALADHAPADHAPARRAPVNPAPAAHAPVNPAPANPAPANPAPANPAPANLVQGIDEEVQRGCLQCCRRN